MSKFPAFGTAFSREKKQFSIEISKTVYLPMTIVHYLRDSTQENNLRAYVCIRFASRLLTVFFPLLYRAD